MMLPPPECSSISGTAAEVSAWAVITLKVNASRKSLVDVFSSGPGMVPPTLLTTMSSLPNSSTAAAARPAVASGWARSPTTMCARRPVARICAATASSSDWVREAMTTSAPTSAKCHRDGGTEAAARAGDHSHLVVEPEFIEDHRGHRSKAGMRVGRQCRMFLEQVLVAPG